MKKVTITSDSSIKFLIKDDDDDRELILILGLMPILPEHIYGNGQFLEANLDLSLIHI